MSDSVRDQLAAIIAAQKAKERARIDLEGDGCVTALDELGSYLDGYDNALDEFAGAVLESPLLLTPPAIAEPPIARISPPGTGVIVQVIGECDCGERFTDQRGIFTHVLMTRHAVTARFIADDGTFWDSSDWTRELGREDRR